MKTKKQWIVGVVLLALCGSLLAGCSSNSDNSDTGGTGGAGGGAKGKMAKPASGGSAATD